MADIDIATSLGGGDFEFDSVFQERSELDTILGNYAQNLLKMQQIQI